MIGGVLLLAAGGGWWFYKRKQTQQASTLSDINMHQQLQPASHYIPPQQHGRVVGGPGAAGVGPGTMMALVCCLGLLSITSTPISVAAAADPVVPVLYTYLEGPYCRTPYSTVSMIESCELVSGGKNVLRSHFVTIDCSSDGLSATVSIWLGYQLTCDGSAGELVRTIRIATTPARPQYVPGPATCFNFQSKPDTDLWARVYCPANFTRAKSGSSSSSTANAQSTSSGSDSAAAATSSGESVGSAASTTVGMTNMTLLCCLALMVLAMVQPVAAKEWLLVGSATTAAAYIFIGEWVVIVVVIAVLILLCCPGLFTSGAHGY